MSDPGEIPFSAGLSVAPVTDWRLYDTAYTERFMNTPQANLQGCALASLLVYLLVCQGSSLFSTACWLLLLLVAAAAAACCCPALLAVVLPLVVDSDRMGRELTL
jgi:hypothetical protein